ncbi:hypothetical protein BpHYR1_040921 [Brachionus plicatilis]|uniref:Uncharacterized protein n=1 Tax=Brachionus plicatilis TaxID=10195 RepID=A0A3M7SHU8_BRAPC|nr:hypothetical protein BpHYR1_040921 [Brachionus plicatilis]
MKKNPIKKINLNGFRVKDALTGHVLKKTFLKTSQVLYQVGDRIKKCMIKFILYKIYFLFYALNHSINQISASLQGYRLNKFTRTGLSRTATQH